MSILAAVSIAVLAVACKKDEPATSETFTTGAPVTQEQPAVQPQVTTGTTTTETPDQTQQTSTTSATMQKGKDAGIASDIPSGGNDLIDRNPARGGKAGSALPMDPQVPKTGVTEKDPSNHSTPLGDGKSGSYTDGKGTHGGKATWGTGPHKDTKMDQPTPSTK